MKIIHIANRGQYYNAAIMLSLTKIKDGFMLRFIHTPTWYIIDYQLALELLVWLAKDELSPKDSIFRVECKESHN